MPLVRTVRSPFALVEASALILREPRARPVAGRAAVGIGARQRVVRLQRGAREAALEHERQPVVSRLVDRREDVDVDSRTSGCRTPAGNRSPAAGAPLMIGLSSVLRTS